MEPLLTRGLLTLYYVTLGLLAFYGTHRLVLVAGYLRTRKNRTPKPSDPETWPRVTVQLPIYNELYVAERLIEATCRLDYPRDRLEIQVLDDSTDETKSVAARTVERFRELGFNIRHLHRTERVGFKAGALAAGMADTRSEFLAVFDADFVPTANFLKETIPYFANRSIGMVQARWGHINRDYSLLTRIQAIFLDGHFLIEHAARNRTGCFFNFNGTAGVWRRGAIEEAGGWTQDTLTEDLDLSYRAQLAGWKFLFLPDLTVPAELPVDVHGFKSQQFRWAKGSIQTARKLLPTILRAPVPWRVKSEAFVHLTNNVSYLLMVLLSLLVFPAMLLRRGTDIKILLLVDLPLFLSATVSVLVFYLASQLAARKGFWAQLRRLPPLMGLGIGLAINNSRAVFEGWRHRGGTFERTPKYGIEARQDGWQAKRYRVRQQGSTLVEAALGLYFAGCFATAVWLGMWASLPFLYLFLQGYLYMSLLGLVTNSRRTPPATTAHLVAVASADPTSGGTPQPPVHWSVSQSERAEERPQAEPPLAKAGSNLKVASGKG